MIEEQCVGMRIKVEKALSKPNREKEKSSHPMLWITLKGSFDSGTEFPIWAGNFHFGRELPILAGEFLPYNLSWGR